MTSKMDPADTRAADTQLLNFILSPQGIRARAQAIFAMAQDGRTHFQVHKERLPELTEFVLGVINANYPDHQVPYHSRWRHFEVGDRQQLHRYQQYSETLAPEERARLGLDLILPSVLVDAGAGAQWQYASANSHTVGRSEGLALASLDMFLQGGFSGCARPGTSSEGLCAVEEKTFNTFFKVTAQNPLLGVAGRVQLLKSLGQALRAHPQIFPNQRPGDLADHIRNCFGSQPKATDVLHLVLTLFGDIWPGRLQLDGQNLGDTWVYAPLGAGPEAYVPFHKLSQWLSYSIIETLDANGFQVQQVNDLTGLAEYRNGGLLLDSGVISLRDPSEATQAWPPASELIIEWRALTVHLLDAIAEQIVSHLDTNKTDFPLAKVLEGGTWAAGRKLAANKRSDLSPPLQIISDATVF